MNTATLVTVPLPMKAARYDVHFSNMQRSRIVYVEDKQLHLQMTLWCDCDKCHRREEQILSTLDSKGIKYAVENFTGENQHERFVCIGRNNQDPMEQIKSLTGLGVSYSKELESLDSIRKTERNKRILKVIGIILAVALLSGFVTWIYGFLKPPKQVLMMMGAWATVHGVIMLLRDITSKAKLARLMSWLGGVGFMLGFGIFMGLIGRLEPSFGPWFDHLMKGLPMFFQMVMTIISMAGMLGGIVLLVVLMCGHMVCMIGCWIGSDSEFN